MRNDLNLTPLLRQKFADRPRTLGRYHASELYYIVNGLITPEQWLTPKPKPTQLILAMWNGSVVHEYIQALLPAEFNEVKFEHVHEIFGTNDTITLVVKVDHLPDHINEVWEFKTSKNEMDDAKKEHIFQSKLYCTVTNRPLAKVYQPVQHQSGLYLKHLETVERDDVWFAEQMKKLEEFHKQVLELSYV